MQSPFMVGVLALMLGLSGTAVAQQDVGRNGSAQGEAANYRALDDIPVVDREARKVGEIEQALVDDSGISALVIELDRFLSVSEKEVVVPLDRLHFEADRFSTDLTKEELRQLPEWDE